MAHLPVTVALLLLACVHAAPAPEPSNPKFTFVKDSALGFGAAEGNSKAHGLVQSSKVAETPIEAPVDTGNNVPDVAFLDMLFIATGILKDNKFADKPTNGLPFIG